MDIKDVLLQNENSLPAIDALGAQSTATASGMPAVTASPLTYWKFGVSSVAGLLGMYYLAAGKKQSDLGKMLLGAGLTLASFFLF